MLHDKRIVIPTKLRYTVLQALHSAYQRCTGIQARTNEYIYWPGLTRGIHALRDKQRNQSSRVCHLSIHFRWLLETTIPTQATITCQLLIATVIGYISIILVPMEPQVTNLSLSVAYYLQTMGFQRNLTPMVAHN